MLKKNLFVWLPALRAKAGSDVYTLRLCNALLKHGVNAKISWFSNLYELAPFLLGHAKVPKRTNIVHANNWSAFAFHNNRSPLVSTLHHNVFDSEFLPYKSKLQCIHHDFLIKRYEQLSLTKSDLNIAVSNYTAESYTKTFNLEAPEVIYNWIDTDTFFPSINKPKEKIFKLLFIGNHTRRKGADMLPKIMSALGKGFELHITDGKRGKSNISTNGASLINHGRLPYTEDLVSLYQSCDVLIFPSRLEGFGLAALEAQSCGLPVVATNSSAFPEVVINRETGILCPRDDINAFVFAIKELSNHPTKLAAMKTNAREHVLNSFNESKIINQYISLYQALL